MAKKVDGQRDGPISFGDYGKHRGCSKQAVWKAYERKRLQRSIGLVKGRPMVINVALADEEWNQNAGRSPKSTTGSTRPSMTPAAAAPAAEQASGPSTIQDAIHPGEAISASTLIEAQRIATLERARKLRMENDQAEGRLVAVEEASKEAFEAERIVRESILNLPARLAGELAAEHDTAKVYTRLDAALREALSATADRLLAAAHG